MFCSFSRMTRLVKLSGRESREETGGDSGMKKGRGRLSSVLIWSLSCRLCYFLGCLRRKVRIFNHHGSVQGCKREFIGGLGRSALKLFYRGHIKLAPCPDWLPLGVYQISMRLTPFTWKNPCSSVHAYNFFSNHAWTLARMTLFRAPQFSRGQISAPCSAGNTVCLYMLNSL